MQHIQDEAVQMTNTAVLNTEDYNVYKSSKYQTRLSSSLLSDLLNMGIPL